MPHGLLMLQRCRFCNEELPDWRVCWSSLPVADPVMTVTHEGKTYQVVVRPGPEGRAAFEHTIRRIFRLSPSDSISLTFGCALPQQTSREAAGIISCHGCDWETTSLVTLSVIIQNLHVTFAGGSEVTLSGWESFDAAVFCASLSAGQRRLRETAQQQHEGNEVHPQEFHHEGEKVVPPFDNLRRVLGRARSAFLG